MEAFIASFAAHHAMDKDSAARAQIVVEELLTNLIKYGYPGRSRPGSAELVLRLEPDRLTIELTDNGSAFDPFANPEPDFSQPPQVRPAGGMGLHIVRLLTESRTYRRVDGKNIVHLTLHLHPDAPAAR